MTAETDRELLEAAAKAAGITERESSGAFLDPDDRHTVWDPLHIDGCALRLAVKLRMDVTFNEMDVFAFPPDGSDGRSELINVDDPYAATRRAIVCAAAEVGRA